MTRIKPAKKTALIYSLIMVLFLALIMGVISYGDARTDYDKAEADSLAAPVFSHESGFYDKPFELTMEAGEGCDIYYTLDGSDPSVKSNKYGKPLHIEDATKHENVYSMRTDVSTGFYEDLIAQYSNKLPPYYAAPDYLIDKCTVIKAIAVDPRGYTSKVSCGTFFVDKSGAYDGCDVVSLLVDPADLFDYDTGIYVTGREFADNEIKPGITWTRWRANYRQRGDEWKRDAKVQIFDGKSRRLLEKTCTVSIKGDSTRAYNQKSFRLSFLDDEGELSTLGSSIFGSGFDPESIILNDGGNKVITKFNDYAISELLGGEYKIRRYRPAVVFLDGEYWGFYWICEDCEKDWYEHYYHVDRENIVAVEFKNAGEMGYTILSEDPEAEYHEKRLYDTMAQFITRNDMSEPDNYKKVCEMIDIDNYIDYYALQIYLANHDWPRSNRVMWRAYKKTDDAYGDGRWRCLIYDLDLTMLPEHLNSNTLNNAKAKDDVFNALWENPDFRNQFRERIMYMADHYFGAETMGAYIDAYCEQFEPALEQSWTRFFDTKYKDKANFINTMEKKKEFFAKRRGIVEGWFK